MVIKFPCPLYKWQKCYIFIFVIMFPLSFYRSWLKVVIEAALSEFRICKFRQIVNILEIKTNYLKEKK